FADLRGLSVATLLVPDAEAAQLLHERWGTRLPGELVTREIDFRAVGAPTPLTDLYPSLALLGGGDSAAALWLVRWDHLATTVRTDDGEATTETDLVLDGPNVYWCPNLDDPEQSQREMLLAVGSSLGVRLADDQVDALMQHNLAEQQRRLVEEIRAQA